MKHFFCTSALLISSTLFLISCQPQAPQPTAETLPPTSTSQPISTSIPTASPRPPTRTPRPTSTPTRTSPPPSPTATPLAIPLSERIIYYYDINYHPKTPIPEGAVSAGGFIASTYADEAYTYDTAADLRTALEIALRDKRNTWMSILETVLLEVTFGNGHATVRLQGDWYLGPPSASRDVNGPLVKARMLILLTVFANPAVQTATVWLNEDTIANRGNSNSRDAKPADYVFTRAEIETYLKEQAYVPPTPTRTPTPFAYISPTPPVWIDSSLPLPELPPDAVNLQWMTAYGLSGEQFVTRLHPTQDGGFILVGNTVAGNRYTALLLKLRADGLIVWQKSLSQVRALVVLETSAGDFILVGDLHWLKFDSQGNLLWRQAFEEPSHHIGPIIRLVQESNGNIVVEATGSRAIFNADGELQSFTEAALQLDSGMSPQEARDRFHLEERPYDYIFLAQTTADGGALVGNAVFEDYGDVAIWASHLELSRFAEDDSVRWQTHYCCYLGAGYEDFHAFETRAGDTILAGTVHYYASNEYRNHVLILRLDGEGQLQWQKAYATEGHAPEEQDAITVIQELANGDLLFAGQTSRAGFGGQNMWVLKTNAQGEIPNCGFMFDGSAGQVGDSPLELETTTLDAEQSLFGDNAQTILLCSPEVTSSSTPITPTPGALTCQLNVNQNIHVRARTNRWSQPDVVNGTLIGTLPAGTSVYVINGPQWGRIIDTGVSDWWWEISNTSNGASAGWIWEGRIEEC